MVRFINTAGIATALVLGGTLGASAALLDFTDEAAYTLRTNALATGTINGIGWTLTSNVGDLTYDTTEAPGPIGVLDGDFDGVGVGDDEVSLEPREFVTLSFDRSVTLTGFYFLDLYIAPDRQTRESALVYAGADLSGTLLAEFDAEVVFQENFGYGDFAAGPFTGTTFTFATGAFNDDRGVADYALAGVELAPIPLPAGALLLGTALAGLGLARRWRR